jgi:hypothetical protein
MTATNEIVKIKYQSSVKTPAGWRSVQIVAAAERVSDAMAQVKEVLLIDGETPNYQQSRTGAKRQEFNGKYFATQQIGAKKRIATCQILA